METFLFLLLILLFNYPVQLTSQLINNNKTPVSSQSPSTSITSLSEKEITKEEETERKSSEEYSFQNETTLSFTGEDNNNNNVRHPIWTKNAFSGLKHLKKLTLSNMVNMTIFPDLSGTSSLEVLRIDRCDLTTIPATICERSPKLRSLIIKSNRITSIPILEGCTELRLLDLSYNEIRFLGNSQVQYFRNQSKLIDLILNHNLITELSKDTFTGLSSLQVLDLESNKIKRIHPSSFEPIKTLRDLNLASNYFNTLPTTGLSNLRQIKVFNSPNLKEFPEPDNFPRIQTLALSYSYHCCSYLKLNLDHAHKIASENTATPADNNEDLTETILWLPKRKKKVLKTPTSTLASNAEEDDDVKTVDDAKVLASRKRLQSSSSSSSDVVTNMIYGEKEEEEKNQKREGVVGVVASDAKEKDISFLKKNSSSPFNSFDTTTATTSSVDTSQESQYYDLDTVWKSILAGNSKDYNLAYNQYIEEYFDDYKTNYNKDNQQTSKGSINNYVRYPIQCLPEPGPFMPCVDLFGWWTLRCGVWLVFLLALLGNGVVVVVLVFGRSKIDVPRFLVCNLAMADFFMGLYLGILAIVDAVTLGEFKAFAVIWQTSAGCQIAGFLGVFSSELSVYTLAVITLERNYAITHAMHLNKRLSLKHATYIMTIGWIFALIMALLPLFGISDYRKFAVCLPFEVEKDTSSLTYVVSLITLNGIAFFTLMACYLKMYCAIRGSQAWNSNDTRIAKRMALLVFTDFLCWAPIAFFSATAMAGHNLISLEEAKVFTIFILPLNSCCNPFLYAIFTKKFKKDCIMLCKRIEESRFTRGLGRGRHSSNFSNRQTPFNSNSAADKRSVAIQGLSINTLEREKLQQTSSEKDGHGHRRLGHVNSNATSGSSSLTGYCKCGHSLVPSNRLRQRQEEKQQQKTLKKMFWKSTPSNTLIASAEEEQTMIMNKITNPRERGMIINSRLSPSDKMMIKSDAANRLLINEEENKNQAASSQVVSKELLHYQKRSSGVLLKNTTIAGHGKRLHSHDSTISSTTTNSTFKTSTTRGSVSSNNSSRLNYFHSTATDSTTVPLSRTASSATTGHGHQHKSLEQSISANSTSYGSSDVILGPMDTPETRVIRPLFDTMKSDSGQTDDIEMGHRRTSNTSSSDGSSLRRRQQEQQRLCHECARQEALLAKKKAKNKNKPKRNHVRLDDLELEDKMNRYFKKLTLTHESNVARAADTKQAVKEEERKATDNSLTSNGSSGSTNAKTINDSSSSQVTTDSQLSGSSFANGCVSSASASDDDANKDINQFFLKCTRQPFIHVNPSGHDDVDTCCDIDNDQETSSNYSNRGDIFLFVDREEVESNSRSPSTLSVRTAVAVTGCLSSGRCDSRNGGTITPTEDILDTMTTRLMIGTNDGHVTSSRSLVELGNNKCSKKKELNLKSSRTTKDTHVYSSSASASSCQLSSSGNYSSSGNNHSKEVEDLNEEIKVINVSSIKKSSSSSETSLKRLSTFKSMIPNIIWRSFSSHNNASFAESSSPSSARQEEEKRVKKKLIN